MCDTCNSIKPYQPNKAEKRLIEALRSGKYQQSTSYLKTLKGYCCLGVASEISGLGVWDAPDGDGVSVFREVDKQYSQASRIVLLQPVRDELGWVGLCGELEIPLADSQDKSNLPIKSLSDLNDDGFTFDQIADVIENGLVRHYEGGGF